MSRLATRALGLGVPTGESDSPRIAVAPDGRCSLVRDPILVALMALAGLTVAWYASGWGAVAAQVIVLRVSQPALNLAMAVLSRRTAKLPGLRPPARRFWHSMSICGVVLMVGNGTQAYLTLRHPSVESASMGTVQGICQLIATAFPVGAMLIYPIGLRVRRKRQAFWMDAATVMVAAVVFIWYFLIGNAIGTAHMLASLAGAALLPVAVFAVVKLLLSGSAPFTRAAAVAGASSAVLEAVTGSASPLLLHSEHLNLLLAVSVLPAYLFAATPRVQELRLRADPTALGKPAPRYSRLPYLAVALTHGLLAVTLIGNGINVRIWGVLIGALVITALVVLRQLAAFAENSQLLARLDLSLLEVSRQEERFRSLVQHATEITLITDRDGRISYASPAIERVLGIEPDAAVGQPWRQQVHPENVAELDAAVTALLATPGLTVVCHLRARHADGTWRWLETISTNLLDDPSVAGVICNARDISEARQFQDRLRHQALHDPLTQLPNRALFSERVGENRRRQVAVLLIDLDDFKAINDTLGHHVGDAVLVAVADRLRSKTRPGDVAARLGGDEFAVLLPDATKSDAEHIAARIMAEFDEPVTAHGHRLEISASIGVAVGMLDEDEGLLHDADAAMYREKRRSKASIAKQPAHPGQRRRSIAP